MVFQRYFKTFQIAFAITLYCIVVQTLSQFHAAQAVLTLLMKYTHTSRIFDTQQKSIEVVYRSQMEKCPPCLTEFSIVAKTLTTFETKDQRYCLRYCDLGNSLAKLFSLGTVTKHLQTQQTFTEFRSDDISQKLRIIFRKQFLTQKNRERTEQ